MIINWKLSQWLAGSMIVLAFSKTNLDIYLIIYYLFNDECIKGTSKLL